MMGINVRNLGIRYADAIVDGHKALESRNTDSLRPYVGRRVAIVRTGEGRAAAIGEVTVGQPVIVNEAEFRRLQDQHLVPLGSAFDVRQGGVKYLYPMLNPVRYRVEVTGMGHGIIARQIEREDN